MKRLALLLCTERCCSSQLMGIFSFRQGPARKRKIIKTILIIKIWIADFRRWRKHELFLRDDHATKICDIFFFCCRSQPGVYQVCLFKSFFFLSVSGHRDFWVEAISGAINLISSAAALHQLTPAQFSFVELLRCYAATHINQSYLMSCYRFPIKDRQLPAKSTSRKRLCRQKHDIRSLNLHQISLQCQHFHSGSACQICPLGKSLLPAILSGNHYDRLTKMSN